MNLTKFIRFFSELRRPDNRIFVTSMDLEDAKDPLSDIQDGIYQPTTRLILRLIKQQINGGNEAYDDKFDVAPENLLLRMFG